MTVFYRCGISKPQQFEGIATEGAGLPSNIASFMANASGLLLPTLKTTVEAVQSGSGTPSPSNPRPITGWSGANVTRTGKNLFGGDEFADIIVANVSGATKDTANKTVSYSAVQASNKVLFTKFKPNTRYTIIVSLVSGNANLAVNYTDGTTSALNSGVFVTNARKSVAYIRGQNQGGTTVANYDEIGVFEGVLTADDFVPYNGNTYTISFGDIYYGGELDVTTGLLKVENAIVDLGSLTWTYANNAFAATGLTGLIDYAFKTNTPMICANYDYLGTNSTGTSWFADKPNNTCGSFFVSGNPNRAIYVKDTAYTDATTFKSAMNGVMLVYELATPIEIQLTPQQILQLANDNNVFADCGKISELEYIQIQTGRRP